MPKKTNRSTRFTTDFLAQTELRFIDLVKIELPSDTLLYTNYEADTTITLEDGSTTETYLTGQGYLEHSNISKSSQAKTDTLEITFDATTVDSTATAIAPKLANSNVHGAAVTIRKAYVDSTGVVFNFIAYQGIIDNFSLKYTDDGASATIFCGGEFANFDKVSLYGFTNTTSQSKVFPLDTGFNFAESNKSNIRWEE
jgi:hypothetical protein